MDSTPPRTSHQVVIPASSPHTHPVSRRGGSRTTLPSTKLVDVIERACKPGRVPLVVSLDGRSGVGKSTLAPKVAEETVAAIVPVDEFYAGAITDAEWDRMTAQERWANVFCWESLRIQVIKPLLAGCPARWFPIDFDTGPLIDGTYLLKTSLTEIEPAPVIILDGVYSSGPQLADLLDLAVLIDAPDEERRARLASREDAEFLAKWHARWDAVEDFYFSQVRARNSFDLVVTT